MAAGGVKRPKKLKRGALVFVHWTDIIAGDGKWFDPDECRQEMHRDAKKPHITSVGFVLDSTTRYLALCLSMSILTHHAMHSLQIPWSCVRSVARLKVGKDYR